MHALALIAAGTALYGAIYRCLSPFWRETEHVMEEAEHDTAEAFGRLQEWL
jgi:hypothetical protein